MPVEKRIPERQCTGCRLKRPKAELVRIVRTPEGEITVDFKGNRNGRGAYICPDVRCLRKAMKSNAISRALGGQLAASELEALEAELEMRHD